MERKWPTIHAVDTVRHGVNVVAEQCCGGRVPKEVAPVAEVCPCRVLHSARGQDQVRQGHSVIEMCVVLHKVAMRHF